MHRYFTKLSTGKLVLWCYLIWYVVAVISYFDPAPDIWLNAVGVSVVIGVALLLSVGHERSRKKDRWQTFRLFLMPFCVYSFSSLTKDKGYILIFPRRFSEQLTSVGLCATFVLIVVILKRFKRHPATAPPSV